MRSPALAFLTALTLAACGRSEPVRYTVEPGEAPLEEPHAATPLPPLTNGRPGCTETASETYTIEPAERRPIDVLFVIDDSCSMENDQRALGTNLQSFFSTFQQYQVDFHVGVITTDMDAANRGGRLVAPFLTHQTPDVASAFQRMVNVGTRGSSRERGLSAVSAATSAPIVTRENAGFIRPAADFALVFLTDEDDSGSVSPEALATQVQRLKPDGRAITVGSILLGCLSTQNWRYWRFTRQFADRGIVTRCTQTYASTLRTIAGRAINKRCIVGLRERLDESKELVVTMNGAPTTWRTTPPEDAFPNGTLEVEPCPETGGRLDISWSTCP